MVEATKNMAQEVHHDDFLNFIIEKEEIEVLIKDQVSQEEKHNLISPDSPKYIRTGDVDNRLKRWENKDFQIYLRDYLKKQYNRTDVKITAKFSEKVYRKMYDANIYKSSNHSSFMKVLWHPDVTRADHDYISNLLGKEGKILLYNQATVMGSLMFMYYKTDLGKTRFRNKFAPTLALFGLLPLCSAAATHYYYLYYVNRRINDLGLLEKYQIK